MENNEMKRGKQVIKKQMKKFLILAIILFAIGVQIVFFGILGTLGFQSSESVTTNTAGVGIYIGIIVFGVGFIAAGVVMLLLRSKKAKQNPQVVGGAVILAEQKTKEEKENARSEREQYLATLGNSGEVLSTDGINYDTKIGYKSGRIDISNSSRCFTVRQKGLSNKVYRYESIIEVELLCDDQVTQTTKTTSSGSASAIFGVGFASTTKNANTSTSVIHIYAIRIRLNDASNPSMVLEKILDRNTAYKIAAILEQGMNTTVGFLN